MKRFAINGKVYTLTRARKLFECGQCSTDIHPGTEYYRVDKAGAGLRALKYPDRRCQSCVAPLIASYIALATPREEGPTWQGRNGSIAKQSK